MTAAVTTACATLGLLAGLPAAGGARDAAREEALLPPGVRDIGVDERLGASLPLDIPFVDHRGQEIRIGEILDAGLPTLLVPAYYGCPMLCGIVLHGVADLGHALEAEEWRIGKDYRVVAFSFDPTDGATVARRKRAAVMSRRGAAAGDADWPFLTGTPGGVAVLLESVGLRVTQDGRTGEWAHPPTLVVVRPDGRVATYVHGTDFDVAEVAAALETARDGGTRTPLERLLIACFRYDPATRTFGRVVLWSLRLGGLAIVLALGGLVGHLILRERRGEALQ